MGSMNRARIGSGGLVSAVIIFFISGAVNGAVLGDEWKAWVKAMGPLNHAPSDGVGIGIWLLVSLIYGGAGVWLYAGLRPRFGKGPTTALRSGFGLWLV